MIFECHLLFDGDHIEKDVYLQLTPSLPLSTLACIATSPLPPQSAEILHGCPQVYQPRNSSKLPFYKDIVTKHNARNRLFSSEFRLHASVRKVAIHKRAFSNTSTIQGQFQCFQRPWYLLIFVPFQWASHFWLVESIQELLLAICYVGCLKRSTQLTQ